MGWSFCLYLQYKGQTDLLLSLFLVPVYGNEKIAAHSVLDVQNREIILSIFIVCPTGFLILNIYL